ncbi:autotransporter domain-containing protein [Poriferisphaera sp. WC338]|uniref:autotransporter domain-containing protein n=1 Tax=Poriferisphaera sp. WC338 TaxID=3425129 RepID=UPI003D81ABB5
MAYRLMGVTCLCMFGIAQLHAADVTFTGGTSNVWTVDSNWAGGSAPATNVDGVITIQSGNGASPFTLTGIDLSYININDLTFSSTGTDGDLTLTGTGSFTFNDGMIIENAKNGSMTIDVDLIGTGAELGLESITGNVFVSGNVDLSDSGGIALVIDGLAGIEVSGVISGTGGNVELLGPNTVTLSGNNTYTGGTAIIGNGTLILGNDNALGTDSLVIATSASIQSDDDDRSVGNTVTVASGRTLNVEGSNNLELSGVISGSGSLAVGMDSASDALTLSGVNTYSGGTTLLGSTLILGNNNAVGTGNLSVDDDAAIQSNSDDRTISNTVSISSGNTLTVSGSNDLELTGVISGDGNLSVGMDAPEDDATLSGNNTFTGGTTLASGTIELANDNALGTGALSVTGNSNIRSDDDARSVGNAIGISTGQTLTVVGLNDLALSGVISGDGSLGIGMLADEDDVTLRGNNTYTGGTTLSGGTVVLGDDDALGTGNLSVTGDAAIQSDAFSRIIGNNISIGSSNTLAVNGSFDFTLSGVISGDGALARTSSNILTVTGNNTYSGDTILSDGVLVLGHDNALGTGNVSVTSNSVIRSNDDSRVVSNTFSIDGGQILTVTGGNSIEFSGIMSGSGTLRILTNSIQDIVTLSGNNTYSGGTTLEDGLTILANDNAFGTGSVTVADSVQIQSDNDSRNVSNNFILSSSNFLTISGTNQLTLSGDLSGSGSLATLANSTVLLTGNNTYSGTTFLSGGEVILGNDNAFGTGGLSVISNASFQSNDDARSVGNAISIGSGNTLTASGSNDMELTGVISGDGGVTKEGSGTLTLSNSNNTYTGDTTVNAGTLIINGTMASANVNVASGGTLSGAMNFAGNFINSGTVSPGNSPGTMIVGGNLTLNSTSIYDMEIASTAGPGTGNDFIDVTGTAAIDGTLNVIGLGGYSATDGDTFTILDADGGVSGTFATILDDIAGFEATATYNANDITVTLNAATADFANTVTARNLVFAAEAFTRIANNSPTGDMATVIAQLENQTGNNLVVAFEQIVPNYLVPQAEATFKGIDVQNNNFNGRFNELRNGLPKLWSNNLGVNTPDNASINDSADPEFAMMLAMQAQETLEQQQETARFTGAEKDIWGAWVNGFGTFGDYDSTSSQAGYNFNTGGVTFGFDYRVLDTLAAGAFVGYSNTGVTVDNGQGTNSFNSINTGMYMTWFNEEGFYASGLFGGGVNFYENNRRIRFGTVDRVAESDPTGFYLQTLATGGYEFKKGNWGFGPQLALQWVNLQIGSHSETGADSLNLDVGAFNGNSFVSRLGFRATYEYDTPAMLFVPELVGFWEHEYLDPINTVDVGVPAGGESFSYTGIGPGRDSGLIGVNLVGISHEAPVSFTLQYNVEFTPDDFIVNNVYAGIRISF